MDIRQLRYFHSAVKTGSLTAAAHQVGISQPALTYRLKQLEAELGMTLFVRNPRGVTTTEAGAVLSVHVARLLEDFDAIDQALLPYRASRIQPVVVGMAPTPARALAADLLAWNGVSKNFLVSIREGFSDDLAHLVELGEIDCALCYDPPDPMRQVTRIPVARESLVAIAGPGVFDDIGADGIPFAELAKLPLVLDGTQQAARRVVDEMADQLGLTLNIVTASSVTVKRELVARNGRCTIVPYGLYRDEIEAGLMASRKILAPEIERTLTLVLPTSRVTGLRKLSAKISELVEAQISAGRLRWRTYSATGRLD